MKIVFLVKSSVLMRYYVNEVHKRFPVSLIIEERRTALPRVRSLSERLKQGPNALGRAVLRRLTGSTGDDVATVQRRTLQQREVDEILGPGARAFPAGVPVMVTEDINDAAVRDRLAAEVPEVVLVQGTSIVRDATLPAGVFNFNMHGGLSPYYRGGASARWAIMNWDPYNIGVTLHRLTEQSDAGAILAQCRVVPVATDTSHSISLKLTREGTALALKVLAHFAAGNPITYHPQDPAIGHTYFAKHWHPEMTAAIERIDRDGVLAEMLRRPSTRTRHPIVEWPE